MSGGSQPASAGGRASARDLVARKLQEKRQGRPGAGEAASSLPPPPRRGGAGPFPLTFAQERLWFLDQLEPGNPAYHIARAFELGGPLRLQALHAALAFLTGRHETLRTRYAAAGRQPVQEAVEGGGEVPALVDLSALPPAARQSSLGALTRREIRRPFDLASGRLLRALVLRLAGGQHALVLTFHHIAFDGVSLEIFLGELSVAYGALLSGARPPLPPLPIRFTDYAAWQRRELAGPRLEALLENWRQRLAGAPAACELATDRPRPRVQSGRGAREQIRLSLTRNGGGLVAAVQALAREHRATPFMVLAAAFFALLHRHTGRRDLVLGTPVAGRSRPEVQGLVGFFVNSVVLRVNAGGGASFLTLLERVRAVVLAAHAHQEAPFARLVEELAPERDLSRSPLFQISFGVQSTRAAALGLPGLTAARLDLPREETRFDLTLDLLEDEEGLLARAQYATDLFDPTRMRRLLGHLGQLLAGALAEPGRRLAELPLLSPGEEALLTREWNDTWDPRGEPGPSLQRQIAARERQVPDRVAVVCEGSSLSYRELRLRARRVAAKLRGLGVGPDALVGVCAERSLDLVVGLLGALEAGAAYLPLDPTYPQERLAFMLADSGVPVLLTQTRLLPGLSLPDPAPAVLCLDRDFATAREPGAGALLAPAADNLAYLIYTSGSTGRPKGAGNSHRGIGNLLAWMQATFGLEAGDRVLQKTPVSFDVSVWELFWPLAAGARLVMARPGGQGDTAYLKEVIDRERVTTLHFVPSMLQVFLTQPGVEGCTSLRRVLTGGEALPPALASAFLSRLGASLYHLYGPTEAAVDATSRGEVLAAEVKGGERIPIGRPIRNLAAHVLDGELALLPPGVPGELALGGVGLARGYHRRPALTAERFVPDPVGGIAGGRLYRTGDRCRFLADGSVELLGRIDFQVKVSGFRIELGEIEAVLASHPGVQEVAVVARQPPRDSGMGGDLQLIAYFVPAAEGTGKEAGTGGAASGDELSAHAGTRLPAFMIPTAFIPLEAMPLSPSGKVDRRRLPALSSGLAPGAGDEGEAFAAPRNRLEGGLASLWQEQLGVGRVGIHDSFFALGGNSLTGALLINRLQELLGEVVHVAAIFEAPTVAELALYLARLHPRAVSRVWGHVAAEGAETGLAASPALPAAPPLVALARDPASPSPLSFAQERLWFLDRLEPDSSFYNVPAVLRLQGDLSRRTLALALGEVVRRHEPLRSRFVETSNGPAQVVLPAAAPASAAALPVVDLGALRPAAQAAVGGELQRRQATAPFDLARGRLLRLALISLGSREHRLLLTVHHIVADGWSLGVLTRELASLYRTFLRRQGPELPELPVQYADYALWQRSWLGGAVLERQLAYWRRHLAGLPPLLELPADRPRPPVQSFRGGRLPTALGPQLFHQAAGLARAQGTTPFAVLLAGFQALLGRLGGQRRPAVGSPVAGRNHPAVEGLIGFFVNTLVLAADLEEEGKEPSFAALVAQVGEEVRQALAHQDVPFERLVEALAPERSLAHAPLFQVMFALGRASEAVPLAPGLSLEPLPGDSSTAKFDLTLSLVEKEGAWVGSWQHNSDLFDAATVRRWEGAFRALLAAGLESPGRTLAELLLLAPAERQQLLVEWNDTAAPAPAEETLAGALACRALAAPESVALLWGEEHWSAGRLFSRSLGLVARLRSLGVGPEVPVGVCLPRSPELLVALWGVLAAGGAYVPLDPAYPAERLAFTVEDARAPLVLVSAETVRLLPAALQARLLPLGGEEAEGGQGEVASGAAAQSLAYVIYTSGSTGRPKGVAMTHGSAAAFLAWARRTFSARELAGVAAVTSVCFDLSVFELFVPLAAGGTVILLRDALAVAEAPAEVRERITLLNTVPSAAAELLRLQALPRRVATVNLAGEALPGPLARELLSLGTVERLWNLYGPSEDTTYSTGWSVAAEEAEPAIGRPVDGSLAFVADRRLRSLPLGVPGELLLGGAGLARGYLSRPGQTAERFVPDPCGGGAGSRLYRTGDLVRFRPGGWLDFLGRIDHQVKLRGFRVELGEVESALGSIPGVAAAAVLAGRLEAGVWKAGRGERAELLAAYVEGDAGAAPAAGELRRALGERLPEHMLPGAFVCLEKLPRLPNGKVDRRSLPAPTLAPAETPTGGERAPRTALERALAGIWREVLHLGKVGRDDSFFHLGGHSLRATQVISRIRERLGVELPLRTLFEAPTVARLAEKVEEAAGDGGEEPALHPRQPAVGEAVQPGGLPLSFAQERLFFLARFDPQSTVLNLPVRIGLRGEVSVRALHRALNGIVRRHEVLRTVFVEVEGSPEQRILAPGPVPLPAVDLSALPAAARGELARRLAARCAEVPFDLGRWPLFAACLLRLAGAEHQLLWSAHHIVSDGWSIGVFRRDLLALYRAQRDGDPAPEAGLPELPVQYADFALWQRKRAGGVSAAAELAYWRRQLAGAPAALRLPTDRPRPPTQTYRGEQLHRRLEPSLAAAVRRLAKGSAATLFMVTLAALGAVLGRLAGQRDAVVGSPVAGRVRSAVEGLIGCFLNHLALRLDLTGRPSFRQLLERVRETTLEAFAHQELPFERLLSLLEVERDLSRTPIFQVFLNTLNLPVETLQLPGLEVELRVGREQAESKFDLTLYLREEGDEIHWTLLYNRDLFDGWRMEELLDQLAGFLEQAAAEPERSIEALSLLTAKARALLPDPAAELSAAWVGGAHEIFQAHATAAPERVAVVDGEVQWSYGALEAAGNRLARALLHGGVCPGDRVAIFAHRSAPLVLAALGVLKAGAAFALLDPAYPPARLAELAALARPRGWIALAAAGPVPCELAAALAAAGCAARIELPRADGPASEWGGAAGGGSLGAFSPAPLALRVGPDHPACLTFTSGSSGTPKAVLGRHGSLTHFMPWRQRYFAFTAAERVSLLSGLAHDPLQRDLFTPWFLGATLAIPDPERLGEAGWLAGWMARERITLAHLTPALGRLITTLAPASPAPVLRSLRCVFLVGEILTRRDVARLEALAPGLVCVNHYGSTETQRAVAFHVSTGGAEEGELSAVPLGRGVPDVQLLILNPCGELCGLGELGEITLRSPHLAIGYLGAPGATAARFQPDAAGGGRLYRSGDLGRYLGDGAAVFAGRGDRQVKVRGFRIEPAEVEKALLAHQRIEAAVVAPGASADGLWRWAGGGAADGLLAYAAVAGREPLREDEVRAFLRSRLPAHMVPAAITLLPALPRTPNGKVDLQALPLPGRVGPAGHEPPRGEVEGFLAEIWESVLGVDGIGRGDNFFSLGGHSLLAIQVMARVRQEADLEVPLRTLFQTPRLEEFAAAVEELLLASEGEEG